MKTTLYQKQKHTKKYQIPLAKKIISVAEKLTNTKILQDAFLIINSGRYEFKNKGINVFIKALGELNKSNIEKEVVAVIAVPAYNVDEQSDPILNEIKANNLNNSQSEKVKIIFIPSYLDGKDGLVNIPYFDFLTGFDLSIFPSYYEPWGYTPMESLAFGVPSITTSLAGFGRWMNSGKYDIDKVLTVIENAIDQTQSFDSKSFSSYADYDAAQLLIDVQDQLIEEIVEDLVNDIYMAAAGNW